MLKNLRQVYGSPRTVGNKKTLKQLPVTELFPQLISREKLKAVYADLIAEQTVIRMAFKFPEPL